MPHVIDSSLNSSTDNRAFLQRQEMNELAGRLELLIHGLLSATPSPIPSRFNATKVPKISLGQYIERIMQYCPTSKAAWIVSFIYLKRVLEKCGDDFIHAGSVHRLLLTSVVLGSKFCDDHFKKNTFYARVGGFTVEELNELEVEMLSRLEYLLYVKTSEYTSFENYVYSPVFETMESQTFLSTEEIITAVTAPEMKPEEKIDESLREKTSKTGCRAPFFRVELDGLLVAPQERKGQSLPLFSSPLKTLASLFA